MTALCGGAASQAKAGFAPTVLMSGAALAALLNNVPTPWAVAFGVLIAGVTYDLTTMCTVDPPALPVMTATDMLSIATGPIAGIDYLNAVAKFRDFVKYWAWFQFCECVTIATPAPAAAPAPPANLPSINPPVSAPLPNAPCLSLTQRPDLRNWQYNMAGAHYFDFTAQALPNAAAVTVTGAITGDNVARKLPTPLPASVDMTMYGYTDNAAAHDTKFGAWWYNAAGAGVGVNSPSGQTFLAAPQSASFTIPATADSVQFFAYQNAGQTASVVYTVDLVFRCASSPTFQQPCCPPDLVASGLLTQILQTVTLLQRQLVPFAYIPSTAHAGLTGQGTIAVQGLIGLRIDLTTMPGSLTQDASTPPFVYNVGWVSIEDANGFIDETRAHAQHQNWFSRIASEATLIGYSFAPGVVATITELQREP